MFRPVVYDVLENGEYFMRLRGDSWVITDSLQDQILNNKDEWEFDEAHGATPEFFERTRFTFNEAKRLCFKSKRLTPTDSGS